MNQRQKIVNKLLNQAKKLGLNMDKITEGKSLATLSHSMKTIENLKKRFARQKEQPKLKAKVKKIDKRLERKKQEIEIEKRRQLKRGLITDETKAELKWNHGIQPDEIKTDVLKEKTEKALDDFFNRYFKQIKHEKEYQDKLKEIKKRFGLRIDLANDYMDYLGDLAFKYENPRELMKSDMPQDFVSMMRDRLDNFESIIGREYDL